MRVGFLSHAGSSIYHFRAPIIRALRARGDAVVVLVPRDDYSARLEELDCELVFYELKRDSLNPFIILSNALDLAKILKALHLDLLQTSAHKSNTLGIFAAFLAKIPRKFALVEGLGSFYIDDSFKSLLVRYAINFLYKITFKIADKIIFVSASNAEFMKNLGLAEGKSVLIKSVGIDLKKFYPSRAEESVLAHFLKEHNLPQKPIVLMVSRALWHKGVREFYAAATLLKERANFILVGGRDENPSCADLGFLTSGCVCYLGVRGDIPALLRLCDIFVLPSYKEGFPVSVLEAKACGRACVVSDCEGCVEAVSNGFDGLWVRTGDAEDLAAKIALLLDDERLRANLAQNAFKDALNYDENKIAGRYLALYDEVCGV